MAQMMEEEAWKNLSRNFGFTIQMLEKYQDKLDWNEVSENTTIVWTMDILEKFKKRISWKAFSEYCDENILTPEIVERFKEYFDWHALSSKSDLPMFIYDKYSDLLDWKEIINTYDRRERLNRAFLRSTGIISRHQHSKIPDYGKISLMKSDLILRTGSEMENKKCHFLAKVLFYCLNLAVERTFFAA